MDSCQSLHRASYLGHLRLVLFCLHRVRCWCSIRNRWIQIVWDSGHSWAKPFRNQQMSLHPNRWCRCRFPMNRSYPYALFSDFCICCKSLLSRCRWYVILCGLFYRCRLVRCLSAWSRFFGCQELFHWQHLRHGASAGFSGLGLRFLVFYANQSRLFPGSQLQLWGLHGQWQLRFRWCWYSLEWVRLRDVVKYELFSFEFDGVSCVWTTLESAYDVVVWSESINNLAFVFISTLQSEENI